MKTFISFVVVLGVLYTWGSGYAAAAEADSNAGAATVAPTLPAPNKPAVLDEAARKKKLEESQRKRLENLRKLREMRSEKARRMEQLMQKRRAADRTTAQPGQVQLQQLKLQMSHEQDKHLRRVARLQRIRELAVKQGKTDVVERVDKLLDKENKRYGTKRRRMEDRLARQAQTRTRLRQRKARSTTEAELSARQKRTRLRKNQRTDANARPWKKPSNESAGAKRSRGRRNQRTGADDRPAAGRKKAAGKKR